MAGRPLVLGGTPRQDRRASDAVPSGRPCLCAMRRRPLATRNPAITQSTHRDTCLYGIDRPCRRAGTARPVQHASHSDPAAGIRHFPLCVPSRGLPASWPAIRLYRCQAHAISRRFHGLRMSVQAAYEIGKRCNTPHEKFKAGAGATVHAVFTRQSPDRAMICDDRQRSIAIVRVVRMVVHWVMVSWYV